MSYRIEIAKRDHIPYLQGISRAAAELFPLEDLPFPLRAQTPSPDIFEGALRQQRLWIVLDENKDRVVGFALLAEKCQQIHLQELDIHPEYGRQGLGTMLLKFVISWVKSKKYKQLTLTTFRHLPWNAPFYTKLGFKIIEPSQLNSCLIKLLNQESRGLDKSKRVLMILDLD